MGSAESHHRDSIQEVGHQRSVKRHSCPANSFYSSRPSRQFYPPPILHTLYPDLECHSFNNKPDEVNKTNEENQENQMESAMVDMVLNNNPVHTQLAPQTSSASSVSSGCDSVCEENSDNDAPARPLHSRYEKYSNRKKPSIARQPRLSVDSGTGLDDEAYYYDPFASGDNEIQKPEKSDAAVLIEEEETVETPNEVTLEEEPAPKVGEDLIRKKKGKKHSISKSLKNLRRRALSLPSTNFGDRKKRGEKPANELFGSSYLNREWEIVAVQEMCRRLSLDRLDQLILPIPDGATSSQILDEPMIRQIMEILPARAESYPWVNIYNSEKHGFSLITLYRKMTEWDEEMSPILLIIRDINGGVFGAITSSALLPCEHYVGTGDSCLLFKFAIDPQSKEKELRSFTWTGENQYFVKASKDSISMGAGGGHYGLWLDADLNHGRSMRCETFDNEPLSSEEDFSVQFLEAYGFRMG